VLILDEPTNHLDITACEVLEQALSNFKGTVLFISHDRAFINAVATRVVEILHGELFEFPGNYNAYLAKAKERDPSSPNRLAPSQAGETQKSTASKTERIAARKADREEKKRREKTVRELGKLEVSIAKLEEELEALGLQLADPAVWNDPEQARPIEAERADKQEALDGLYDQWEELSALCED
jgi:ATP-binding cassette subfamily F protein 3